MNASTTASPDTLTRPLLWARLGSLLSFAPLGIWTFIHLKNNLAAFQGPEQWETAVTQYPNPAVKWLTWTVVLAPLIIHTVWGVQRLRGLKSNTLQYPGFSNVRYLLHRISALGVLAFLAAHIWLAMLQPRMMKGHAETFADISAHMRFHLPTTAVYLLGTLGVAYHLANGLAGLAWTWGLVSGRKSQRRFDWVVGVAFVVLLTAAWGALFALWQAGANYPHVEVD